MLLYRQNPDTSKLPYPVYISPKLDGMRAVNHKGVMRSRSLKVLPNENLQLYFSSQRYDRLDGEIICGLPTAPDVLSQTTSLFRSGDKQLPGDWGFYVFDFQDKDKPYETRYAELEYFVGHEKDPHLHVVPHVLVRNEAELLAQEQKLLAAGFEGLVIRCRGGKYIASRTTLKQMNAFKLKRFTDVEGVIVDFFEEMENTNEATVDENLGNTKRSKKQAGLVGKGTLGGFICKVPGFKELQRCGSGFTAAQRAAFWHKRAELLGEYAKMKYFDYNIKDNARHMIFLDLRDMELDG
jgi:DNA ligase-1